MDHLRISIGDEFRPLYYGTGNKFDLNDHDFHSFPDKVGWELDDSTFELTKKGNLKDGSILEKGPFLQSWLFFGLLATVLRDPDWKPEDFFTTDPSNINTVQLPEYLKRWEERESKDQSRRDRMARTLRMIKAEVALAKARKVVIKHCSSEEDNRQGGPGAVHPNLALSLMVLGETLTNAKAKIVERVGFNVRGWHGDANEGWGTPSCVIKQMEKLGWCPRTIYMLEGQLKSRATSLLSVYKAHDNAKIEGHDLCTRNDPCKAKSTEVDGKTYKTKHHPTCKILKDPEYEGCYMIGPEIDGPNGVAEMIEQGSIPLLEYKQVSGSDTWSVEAKPHRPHDNYATISHVWSDGYGNPVANKLHKCQLDFFRELFHEVIPKKMPNLGCSLFWIDTLVIPVDPKHQERRKKAIEQINEIFTKARYTIVVDNGLAEMASGTEYQSTAMKILASGWMRRLWTLQEAYLSRRLLFAFQGPDVRNLDDLEDKYLKASDILESNIPTTARNYFHNLLGNDRNARIHEMPTVNSYALLASIWRAAQWRVGRPEYEKLALATMLNLDYRERGDFSKVRLQSDSTGTGKCVSWILEVQSYLGAMLRNIELCRFELHARSCINYGRIFGWPKCNSEGLY